MLSNDKPIANPIIVFREEFDDWAILFDPDTGKAFGVNPISAFIWKRLDGKHTIDAILNELQSECNVPKNALADINEFVEELINSGLAGYEYQLN